MIRQDLREEGVVKTHNQEGRKERQLGEMKEGHAYNAQAHSYVCVCVVCLCVLTHIWCNSLHVVDCYFLVHGCIYHQNYHHRQLSLI